MTAAGGDIIFLGWKEWVALPDLGIPAIKAKVDTGAKTSALHTFQLEVVEEDGRQQVVFGIHPLQHRTDLQIICRADLIDRRVVRDSGGHREERLVIETRLVVGDYSKNIEITLTNREDMLFRMLLGRSALEPRHAVRPRRSYLTGRHLAGSYE